MFTQHDHVLTVSTQDLYISNLILELQDKRLPCQNRLDRSPGVHITLRLRVIFSLHNVQSHITSSIQRE
jgi:hypothetical protein